MAGSYPNTIKTYTTKTDNIDDVMAEDVNDKGVEITAIETELGTLPKGAHATVKARLEAHVHSGGDGGQVDHGGLAGLSDDDHTQYHNDTRGDARYALIAKGVTNGDSHDHSGGDGAQIDHGGLAGLGDDDHTQYIKHVLATAASDFLVASGSGVFVKKTLAEVLAILNITPYHCRVYNSSVLSIPNETYTTFTFDSEQSDQGGMHSTLTNTSRITIPSAGFYIVGVCNNIEGKVYNAIYAEIQLNGATPIVTVHKASAPSWGGTNMAFSTGYEFAVNDYIQSIIWQSSDGVAYVTPIFWAAKVL